MTEDEQVTAMQRNLEAWVRITERQIQFYKSLREIAVVNDCADHEYEQYNKIISAYEKQLKRTKQLLLSISEALEWRTKVLE